MQNTLTSARKPANLSLDQDLIADAKALGINLSRAAEDGLRHAVQKARAEQWQRENAEAMHASNSWVVEHELPLARHRLF